MTNPAVDPTTEAAAYIRRLHTDFPFFVQEIFRDRGLDKVSPLSEIELDMADFAANGPRKRGTLGFRGIGKTTIVVATLVCWRWRRNRNRRQIIVSKSKSQAVNTGTLIRDWLDSVWFLRDLAPGKDDRDNVTAFNVSGVAYDKQPSLSIFGVEGQLESNRAHDILFDDIETKGNTRTVESRENLIRLVSEGTNILYPDRVDPELEFNDPVGQLLIGTIKHEETIYLNRAKAGFVFRSYPIMYPTPDLKILGLAPIIQRRLDAGLNKPGDPLLPLRFGQNEIADRQAEGRREFMMEHMLVSDLAESDRYPLRLNDLIIHTVDRDRAPVSIAWGERDHNGSTEIPTSTIPHDGFAGNRLHRPVFIDQTWAPFSGTKAAIDPAGRGSDLTGLSIVSSLNGFLWVKHCRGYPGGASSERMIELILACRLHGAREIYIEDNIDVFNTYTESFEAEMRRHFLEPGQDPAFPNGWKASVERSRSTGQKELRIIAALEPLFSTHRCVMSSECLTPDPSLPDNAQLAFQIARITRDRNSLREDGAIDSLSSCVSKWQYVLRSDTTKAAERSRNDQAAKTLEKHRRDSWGTLATAKAPPRFIADA